uniref:uncharacterized protein LOC109953939 n=1 Tax=Monopterus albus TaxID=43700 RepID=UPI0009B402EB
MAKHLRNGHMVHNCTYKSTRLDQHLRCCHSELSSDQVQQQLRWARRTTTIGLLKQLRETNPAVPLASTLDLVEEDYLDDVPLELEKEPLCQNPECKQMRRKVVALQEELRKIRDAYHRQSKLLRQVSKGKRVGRGEQQVEEGDEGEQQVEQEEEQPGPSHVPAPVAEPSRERGPEVPGSVEAGRSKAAKRLFMGTGKGSFLRHIKFPDAYVASIYGHRTGVFKNMTVAEVRGAATEGQPPTGYVIRVSEHKTAKDFGPAQIFLEPEEYGWLLKWLEVRELCSPQGDRVFFTPGKGPVKNLVRYMQEAWAEMGLPGKPTFIDLRTAVSAHAMNVHVPEVREKVARFMCHDTSTADRFYALHLD